jgi:mono/diheme cytochrome c family protein
MAAVVWVTGTQEVEEEVANEAGAGEETTEEPSASPGDPAAGKTVFTSAGCAACHSLADAGATGSVGPNLDTSKPSEELALDRVTNGQGAMPSFKDQLDEQQIRDVAAYVASAAGA